MATLISSKITMSYSPESKASLHTSQARRAHSTSLGSGSSGFTWTNPSPSGRITKSGASRLAVSSSPYFHEPFRNCNIATLSPWPTALTAMPSADVVLPLPLPVKTTMYPLSCAVFDTRTSSPSLFLPALSPYEPRSSKPSSSALVFGRLRHVAACPSAFSLLSFVHLIGAGHGRPFVRRSGGPLSRKCHMLRSSAQPGRAFRSQKNRDVFCSMASYRQNRCLSPIGHSEYALRDSSRRRMTDNAKCPTVCVPRAGSICISGS